MIFNPNNAKVFLAVDFARTFPPPLIAFWRKAFLALGGITAAFALLFGALIPALSSTITLIDIPAPSLPISLNFLYALTLVFLPAGASIGFFEIFFHRYLKRPHVSFDPYNPPQDANMAELLDFESARIIDNTERATQKRGDAVFSFAALGEALFSSPALTGFYRRLGIDHDRFARQFNERERAASHGTEKVEEQYTKAVTGAYQIFLNHQDDRILPSDLLISAVQTDTELKTLFAEIDIDKDDLNGLSTWYESLERGERMRREFWTRDSLLRTRPIGKTWIYGYATHLERYVRDITSSRDVVFKKRKVIGKTREIKEMELILSKSGENNVLLVGEEGVGKDSTVIGFSQLVYEGNTIPVLNFKRVLKLDINTLTAQYSNVSEMQDALIRALNEAVTAGNIILVIDNFHNFVGGQETALGKIDISEILLPYLKSRDIQLITMTDQQNFHKYIESRGDLMSVLNKITVEEPDMQTTLKIVHETIPQIERRLGIMFSYQAIKTAVKGADIYLQNQPFPEKALNLLDEIATFSAQKGTRVVTSDDVNEVLHTKTNIPLGTVGAEEKEKILNLEDFLHERIVNQNEAIKVISEAMRRSRAGLTKRHKPIGGFLFLGPTGVGKTETAKALAHMYFGSEERMIRFDMSQYQDISSIDVFLGSLEKNEPGQFVSKIRDNPFSLILLDEIEKAHRNILNLFLTVFDEGYITDIYGRRVNLEQSIIIATSNAGAEHIREMVQRNIDVATERDELVNHLLQNNYFSPEFLNRFDAVVIYHPLTQEQLVKVAQILLNELAQRLSAQGYEFKVTDELAAVIAELGYDPQFGARPMQRAIQNTVENIISKKIIAGELQKGVSFTVTPEEAREISSQ